MPAKYRPKTSSQLPAALVAGAAGFIGSHLCDVLIHQNCRVYGLDSWSTGKKQNLSHLLDNDRFVFLEHDLNQPLDSPPPRVDYIFHLAGIEAYLNSLDVSLETLLVNSLGTRSLLEIAKDQSAKFLLASTTDRPSDQEAYSHHEAKRFSEALTFEYLNRHQLDCRVVRLGLVYGPRMDLQSGSDLTKFLLAVKRGQPLEIPGQGLKALYLTYISDIIYGLTKAMFSQSSQAKIFTLLNPEKTTVLNLAYQIQEILPDKKIEIKFVPGEDSSTDLALSPEVFASQEDLGWSPKVDLKEGILATLKWLETGQGSLPASKTPQPVSAPSPEPRYTPEELGLEPAAPPESPPPPRPEKPKLALPKIQLPQLKLTWLKLPRFKNPSRRAKVILVAASLLLAYLTLPVITLFVFAYLGTSNLTRASQITDLSQSESLTKLTQSAQNHLSLSRQVLRFSRPAVSLFGLANVADNFDRLLFIGTKLSQGALSLSRAGQSVSLLTQVIFHHQAGNISASLKQIQLNLDEAYSQLSFVESELQSGRELRADLSTSLNQKLQQLTRQLPQIRQKINKARLVLPLLPSLIAQDSKKVYLVLFQNSAELRPTGGFIGSYGLLTFEKGKLLDFTVEDIYAADGQLKGYVEPPEPLKKFLGQNTWYFRDSNWDPDFTISGERAEWFLNKTTNRSVDGVIAVNLPAVKEILKATGPITLTDYNEEVTADNLFERAEYHSEIDFFPGSTQKKDFLGALSRELFVKLKDGSPADLIAFGQSLETAMTQKQILVYLHDPDSQKILLSQNWAGAIYAPNLTPIDNRPVTSDYSYLVEANLGINKANYFLTRSLEQQLTILKNRELLAVTTVNYHNQSPADAWPGGIYRAYVRHYRPQNSGLVSVKIDDSKLSDDQLNQTIVNDKLVLGFPITVPVKNTLKLEITYRLPQPLSLTGRKGRLAVVIPKQPGTLADPLSVIVNYPSFLTVASLNPQGLVSPQVVSFQADLVTDRVFLIDFFER